MTEHLFSLVSFDPTRSPTIALTGRISRQNNLLFLHYSLTGNVGSIVLPSWTGRSNRRHELWKATCFEFFLARKDQSAYWEFNMSPSGDWNVYRIDAYRRIGFREDTRVQELQVEARKGNDAFGLVTQVDLSSIFSEHELLQASITAVIQTVDGNESYWALTHPGPQADFHLRESFILELAGQTHLSRKPAPGD